MCGKVTTRTEPADTVPTVTDWHLNREGTVSLPASAGDGAGCIVTNGVSLLQTKKNNSTCWSYCNGYAFPPNWSKASHPARHGGAHDHHHRFYHGLILSGR